MSKSPMFWIVSTVVALAAALVAALMTTRASDGDTSPVDESLPLMDSSAYEGMAIIPFRMVDQNGNSATEAMLDGHWTVMRVRSCRGTCIALPNRTRFATSRFGL